MCDFTDLYTYTMTSHVFMTCDKSSRRLLRHDVTLIRSDYIHTRNTYTLRHSCEYTRDIRTVWTRPRFIDYIRKSTDDRRNWNRTPP
jgi:hypothetical protein